MRATLAFVMVGAVTASTPALASPLGGLGGDLIGLGLAVGPLRQSGTLSDDTGGPGPAVAGDGTATFFRFRAGGVSGAPTTRFGSHGGVEVALGLGFLSYGAIAHDRGREGITTAGVWADMDLAVLASPVGGKSWRLFVAGGATVSTERAAWIVGPRLSVRRGRTTVGLRGDWRPGRAWGGYSTRELRAGVDLSRGFGYSNSAIGLGVELWRGETVDDAGLAPRMRALRGEYTAVLAVLERRWR